MNKDRIQDAISDNEIRILGSNQQKQVNKTVPQRKFFGTSDGKKVAIISLFILVFIILVVLAYLIFSKQTRQPQQQETGDTDTFAVYSEKNAVETMTEESILIIRDTVINDIPLQIFTPKACQLSLYMGPMPNDDDILLLVQASDIRRDKDLPAGAFVYNGELIAKGHSKYGFCAIIGDDITLGRQLETTLFERAIEENGSFFRQYSIVSAGQLIPIPPKGKAMRKALCLRNGELQVIITEDKESYHDFSQALVDLGIEEAISLVGGTSPMLYKNAEGETVFQDVKKSKPLRSENYLVWRIIKDAESPE